MSEYSTKLRILGSLNRLMEMKQKSLRRLDDSLIHSLCEIELHGELISLYKAQNAIMDTLGKPAVKYIDIEKAEKLFKEIEENRTERRNRLEKEGKLKL